MQELLQRLQEATEGSREYDAEIAVYAGWQKKGENSDWFSLDGTQQRSSPPRYTVSIDAALTLVPESDYSNKASFLQAACYQSRIGDIPDERLALHLCIAALKARMEE